MELFIALVNNEATRVYQLLNKGINLPDVVPDDIVPDDMVPGTTSLHLSAYLGYIDCVKVCAIQKAPKKVAHVIKSINELFNSNLYLKCKFKDVVSNIFDEKCMYKK